MDPNCKTEKEKMIAGEMYHPWDPELLAERQHAKALCFKLNQICPTETGRRQAIIKALLPAAQEAWLESPFNCDYGYNIRTGRAFTPTTAAPCWIAPPSPSPSAITACWRRAW